MAKKQTHPLLNNLRQMQATVLCPWELLYLQGEKTLSNYETIQ